MVTKKTRAEKLAEKIADKRIDAAYRATCCNIQIDMMDISKIFDFGRLEIAKGSDDDALKSAIRSYVETIRKN